MAFGVSAFDEVGVLSEATGVEVKGDVVLAADGAHGARIFHGHRLPAARIVGDSEHDERHPLPAHALDEPLEPFCVHVPLKGTRVRGFESLRRRQIQGLGAREFDVGARRVKVRVVGHHVALLAHHAEQNPLRRPPLMSRDHVLVAENALDRAAKALEAGTAGVALVAFHHRGPLAAAHGAGAGVRQQVDQHVFGRQQEEVVMRRVEIALPFLARRPLEGLDALDLERFDDGSERHGSPAGSGVAKIRRSNLAAFHFEAPTGRNFKGAKLRYRTRIASTSIVISTSLPTTQPPPGIGEFQLTPKS